MNQLQSIKKDNIIIIECKTIFYAGHVGCTFNSHAGTLHSDIYACLSVAVYTVWKSVQQNLYC